MRMPPLLRAKTMAEPAMTREAKIQEMVQRRMAVQETSRVLGTKGTAMHRALTKEVKIPGVMAAATGHARAVMPR